MSTECPCCGSTELDRDKYRVSTKDDTVPLSLQRCPHCEGEKCCMCDMGDDVRCLGCESADGGDLE